MHCYSVIIYTMAIYLFYLRDLCIYLCGFKCVCVCACAHQTHVWIFIFNLRPTYKRDLDKHINTYSHIKQNIFFCCCFCFKIHKNKQKKKNKWKDTRIRRNGNDLSFPKLKWQLNSKESRKRVHTHTHRCSFSFFHTRTQPHTPCPFGHIDSFMPLLSILYSLAFTTFTELNHF